MQHEPGTEPSPDPLRPESMLVDLISRLFRDAETLLLQEFALARAEIGEALGHIMGGGLLLLIGIAVSFVGGLALIAAIIILLGQVLPPWAACALVGVAILAVGAVLFAYGRHLVAQAALLPRRTVQSVRDTGAWAREELT